jgi:ABC-2 type transport system ATP-binding protein
MDELLTVRGVRRSYGARVALDHLDLQLTHGEVLGLLGPNGAGKTTCLQILSGNLAPSSGEVRVLGLDLARDPLRAKRLIGYLPEHPPLYLDMRVEEYLDYCARLRRVPRGARGEAVRRALARCGLRDARRRILGRLSKGYRQRAGIAQAIVHEPDLVILDEPTDGLDPVQIREVRELIGELAGDAGVIVSSHILPEVQAVCSRAVILKEGRVLHETRLDHGAGTEPHAGRYRVRLGASPPVAALQGLAAVAEARDLGDGTYQVTLGRGEPAANLAAQVVERAWGLAELTPERTDLERVFFAMLGGEQAA